MVAGVAVLSNAGVPPVSRLTSSPGAATGPRPSRLHRFLDAINGGGGVLKALHGQPHHAVTAVPAVSTTNLIKRPATRSLYTRDLKAAV